MPAPIPRITRSLNRCSWRFLKGFKVAEVPVRMNYREYGNSSITPFRAVYYMTKVLLAMFIDLFREF